MIRHRAQHPAEVRFCARVRAELGIHDAGQKKTLKIIRGHTKLLLQKG